MGVAACPRTARFFWCWARLAKASKRFRSICARNSSESAGLANCVLPPGAADCPGAASALRCVDTATLASATRTTDAL